MSEMHGLPAAQSRSVGCGEQSPANRLLLTGNSLPMRWAGRDRFTILTSHFRDGNGFFAAWQAWRDDPQRCQRLVVVALAPQPPTRAELAAAAARETAQPAATGAAEAMVGALLAAWPPLTRNLHLLDFEDGRVQLLLVVGDLTRSLPALQLQADAFHLASVGDYLAQQVWEPRAVKTLARKAAPGATLVADWASADFHGGLRTAGFALRAARDNQVLAADHGATLATYAPTFTPRAPRTSVTTNGVEAAAARADEAASSQASTTIARSAWTRFRTTDAVVIGAGIAGAAVAQALARQGLNVTVCDRHAEPAMETSGNAAGLFHGTVHAEDGIHARFFRAAALQAQRDHARAIAAGVPGSASGLLRLASAADTLAGMQARLQRLRLPPDYVEAVNAERAAQLAGVPLVAPAWFYPGGGWIAPQTWVRAALLTPGVVFVGGCAVTQLERDGDGWLLHDAEGSVIGTRTVVLACAGDATKLLAPLGLQPVSLQHGLVLGPAPEPWPTSHPAWPLSHSRGQVTLWAGASAGTDADAPQSLRLPVAGDGYAIPLPDGGLMCGATREPGSPADGARTRQQDHMRNIERLSSLTGLRPPMDSRHWQGRVGWRLQTDDSLPIAGALPLACMPTGQRLDQARLLPREKGLFAITALGARGLTVAPLLARLVAAQVSGSPWPVEQDLADAVDPARWLVRAARSAAS